MHFHSIFYPFSNGTDLWLGVFRELIVVLIVTLLAWAWKRTAALRPSPGQIFRALRLASAENLYNTLWAAENDPSAFFADTMQGVVRLTAGLVIEVMLGCIWVAAIVQVAHFRTLAHLNAGQPELQARAFHNLQVATTSILAFGLFLVANLFLLSMRLMKAADHRTQIVKARAKLIIRAEAMGRTVSFQADDFPKIKRKPNP